MTANRHITPKPGQGARVWADWSTLVSWLPASVGQNSVTGFRHESGSLSDADLFHADSLVPGPIRPGRMSLRAPPG